MDMYRPRSSLPAPKDCSNGLDTSKPTWDVRTHKQRTAQMTKDLHVRFGLALQEGHKEAGLAADYIREDPVNDPRWNVEVKECFEEFCSKHLTVLPLKVMAFLYNVETPRGMSSAEICASLMAVCAMPIKISDLRDWYGRYCAVKNGNADPGPDFIAPDRDPAIPVIEGMEIVELGGSSAVVVHPIELDADEAKSGTQEAVRHSPNQPLASARGPHSAARRTRGASPSENSSRGSRSRSPSRGRQGSEDGGSRSHEHRDGAYRANRERGHAPSRDRSRAPLREGNRDQAHFPGRGLPSRSRDRDEQDDRYRNRDRDRDRDRGRGSRDRDQDRDGNGNRDRDRDRNNDRDRDRYRSQDPPPVLSRALVPVHAPMATPPSEVEKLAQMLARAINSNTPNSNNDDEPIKSGGCRVVAFTTKMQKWVDTRQLVPIEKLGADYMNKLRSSTYDTKKHKLPGGIYLTTNDSHDDFDDSKHFSAMREGMDVYIGMHYSSKVATVRALAPDRSEFNRDLWQLPIGSFAQKSAFLKDFVAVYYAKDEWLPRLRSDMILITKHFGGAASGGNPNPRKPSSDRGGDIDASIRKRRREDDRRPSGPKPFCHSRTRQTVGECLRSRCIFDHACPTCPGSSHCAKKCPKFNLDLVKKAISKRQTEYRRN